MRSEWNERNCLYFPFFPPITSIHSAVGVWTCLMKRKRPDSPLMDNSVSFSIIRPLCFISYEIVQSGCISSNVGVACLRRAILSPFSGTVAL